MNMKILAVTTLALGTAVFAGNSNAATDSADASATVIVPITILNTVPLVFGSFAPGAGGIVTVDTNNGRTAAGPILSAISDTPTAALFTVTGQPDATYAITISDSDLDDGALNTMTLTTISDLTGAGGASADVATGTLTGGTQTIYVGGTLTVDGAQVDGDYTGTIDVEVEYN